MMTIGGSSRLDRAELGDRHLEVGQHFEQIGLERPRRCGRARRSGGPARRAGSGSSAWSSGRLIRKRSEKTSLDQPLAVDSPAASASADLDHLRARSSTRRRPRRRRGPHSTAGGSAGGRALAPAPWRSRSCRRPASPSRNSGRFSCSARNSTVASAAVGDIAAGLEQSDGGVDGLRKAAMGRKRGRIH